MSLRLPKSWILPVAALAICIMPASSRAALTIALGNGSPTNTLQFVEATGTTGTVFTAGTNDLGPVVQVTLDQQGKIQGTGQASIIPTGGNFTTVQFSFIDPFVGTTGIEINPGFGNDLPDGTTFTVVGFNESGAPTSRSFVIDNNNRFTIENGTFQFITGVTITTAPLSIINVIEQIRIGDVVRRTTPEAVPEPSTIVMTMAGIIPLGIVGLRRRLQGRGKTSA